MRALNLSDSGSTVTAARDELSDNNAAQQLMESGNFFHVILLVLCPQFGNMHVHSDCVVESSVQTMECPL